MQYNLSEIAIMDKRRAELLDLSSYIQTVDNDVTMILQSLQWDRNHLIEATPMVSCSYDNNHRVPPDKQEDHEEDCHLRILGYSKEDLLLPEPPDEKASTLVKLNNDDIANIIEYTAKIDPVFKKGRGPGSALPLSLARLQHGYSTDERRAIHDAVVSAVPACHDLVELALLGDDGDARGSKQKSRAEILAELRDMKRRRTKYRGAAKTRNYSDVLRDLIQTQMEHYSVVQDGNPTTSENGNKSKTEPRHTEDYIKKEPLEEKSYSPRNETKRNPSNKYENHYRDQSKEELRHRYARDDTHRNDRSRDKYKEREDRYDEYKKHKHKDHRSHRDERDQSSSSKERSRDRKDHRSDKYGEDSRRRDYKDYKYSKNSESRQKSDYDQYEKPYREEKHKRYYEHKQDEFGASKRIKQEKY